MTCCAAIGCPKKYNAACASDPPTCREHCPYKGTVLCRCHHKPRNDIRRESGGMVAGQQPQALAQLNAAYVPLVEPQAVAAMEQLPAQPVAVIAAPPVPVPVPVPVQSPVQPQPRNNRVDNQSAVVLADVDRVLTIMGYLKDYVLYMVAYVVAFIIKLVYTSIKTLRQLAPILIRYACISFIITCVIYVVMRLLVGGDATDDMVNSTWYISMNSMNVIWRIMRSVDFETN